MTFPRTRLIHVLCCAIVTSALATTARADDAVDTAVAHMGFGAGVTFNKPTSNDGHSNQGIALVYRWHGFHSGWGPSLGIDWHSTDFDHTFGSTTVPMGTLRTRAVLVGYGYTKHLKRFSTSAGVGGGYSFNDFSTVTSLGLIGVDTHNSWVVRPDVSAWYDVFKHLAVGISAAYLVNRPEQTLTTPFGAQTQRLHGDTVELVAGVAVGVWKKKT